MENFKLGDLVQLKSGSPVMTVMPGQDADETKCIWYNEDLHRFDYAEFDPACLVLTTVQKVS